MSIQRAMGGAPRPGVRPRMIGQTLLARGLITEQQLEEARSYQRANGERQLLGEALVALGFVSKDQVAEALAESYGLPFAHVTAQITDPRVLDLLPREFLEEHCVLPMFKVNGKLTVAVPEPANVFLIEEVQRLAGCPVQLVVSTAEDIRQTLRASLPDAEPFDLEQIVDQHQPEGLSLVEEQPAELADLERMAGQSPVVKLVNHLIYSAVQDGASDIHVEPDENRLRVRLRVDGRLFEKLCPPAHMGPAVVSRIKIMASLDIAERRLPQDGDIHVMLDGRRIDLRVSTMPGRHGEKVVLRVIDDSSLRFGLDKLGFDRDMVAALRQAVNQPHGMILLTGPTGSGKTTTLYAMLSEINRDDVNICTVEDPIEHNLVGINQFATNEKAGFTFAGALRALLRQDPDVIMVGEIRDLETARIATQAAMTGHLVLSTVHTNDAPSAVTRLADIGIEPFLIAASLRAVLAQRLVRRVCSYCKEPVEPSAVHRQLVEDIIGPIEAFHHGVGCSRCNKTGYKGRIGLYELFLPGEAIMEMVARGATLQEIRRAALEHGFVTLRQDGMEKIRAGLTTIEEVIRVTAA